jgi:Ca2+-binding EF-hand superfamily protein
MINDTGSMFEASQMASIQSRIANAFQKADANSDGSPDTAEIGTMADNFSEKLGKSVDAGNLISSLDSDGDGLISSDEFKSGRPESPPPGMMGMMGGGLQPDSVQNLMTSMKASTSESAATEAFDPLDINEDGIVDEKEAKAGLGLFFQQYLNQMPDAPEQDGETKNRFNLLA